jgi:hypothetical protein
VVRLDPKLSEAGLGKLLKKQIYEMAKRPEYQVQLAVEKIVEE